MKTKSLFQKVVVSSTSSTSSTFKLFVGGTYRTVKEVATACGVYVPPRHAFGFLDQKHAVCCVHLNCTPPWNNNMNPARDTICEKRLNGESAAQFQKRVYNDSRYDVNLLRFVFVKEKVGYRFAGVFRVAAFDFLNSQVIFKKVKNPTFQVRATVRKKVTIEVEIEKSITII